jgi:hypothetical protein
MIPNDDEPPRRGMASLRAGAQQLLSLARSQDGEIFRELVALAAAMEAYADRIERAAQRTGQDRLSGLAAAPGTDAARLLSVVHETLELAVVRAEAGQGAVADKLVAFAADLEVRAQRYIGGRPPRKADELDDRVRQLRLRADENRTIAGSITNPAAKQTLITAAESCERMAKVLDLHRLRHPPPRD